MRSYQEDRYCVHHTTINGKPLSFYGIFDGHGGCHAAQYDISSSVTLIDIVLFIYMRIFSNLRPSLRICMRPWRTDSWRRMKSTNALPPHLITVYISDGWSDDDSGWYYCLCVYHLWGHHVSRPRRWHTCRRHQSGPRGSFFYPWSQGIYTIKWMNEVAQPTGWKGTYCSSRRSGMFVWWGG